MMLSLFAAAASSALGLAEAPPESNLPVVRVDSGVWTGQFTVRTRRESDHVEMTLVGRMDFPDDAPAFDAMLTFTVPVEAVRVDADGRVRGAEDAEYTVEADGAGAETWTGRFAGGGSMTVRQASSRSLRLTRDQKAALFDALLGDASDACHPSFEEALPTAQEMGAHGLASFTYGCDLTTLAGSVSFHMRDPGGE